MKSSFAYSLFTGAIFLLFFSCEQIKEITTIKFDSTEIITITTTLFPGEAIEETMEIDLSESSKLGPHLDRLKDADISEAYYVIKSFDGNTDTTGTLSLIIESESFGPFQHNFAADQAATKQTPLDAEKLNIIANVLLTQSALSLYVNGSHTATESTQLVIEIFVTLELTTS